MEHSALDNEVRQFSETFKAIEGEIAKSILGLKDVIKFTLAGVFAGGHVLLEGAPGLGKTRLVRALAQTLGLTFNRIQFTSDLMPSDITGTQVLAEDENSRRTFQFKPGPVFTNILLADEVNRTGPKTQSALLEAMEEGQVTVLGTTYPLPKPFFVLATQNPIELEGTYPLPEAQLDRFLLKLVVPSPSPGELKSILRHTTGTAEAKLQPVFSQNETTDKIITIRNLVRSVVVAPQLEDALVGTLFSLTPGSSTCADITSQYVRYGPGPRGAQAVLLVAKVLALLDGRINLAYEDLAAAFLPALRHRLVLNYQADADSITADNIISQVRDAL